MPSDNLQTAMLAYQQADQLVREASKLPFISFETPTGENLNPLQSMVLQAICFTPRTPTDLADQFSTATPTMSHVLSALQARRLIELDREYKGDGRVRVYKATPEGRTIVEHASSLVDNAPNPPKQTWINATNKMRTALLNMR